MKNYDAPQNKRPVRKPQNDGNNEEKFGRSELQLLNLIAEIIVEIILKEEEEERK